MLRRAVLGLVAVLAIAGLAACGGPSTQSENAITPAASASSVPVSHVKVALCYINKDAATDPTADPASTAAISAVRRAITDFGIQATMIPDTRAGENDSVMIARLASLAKQGYNPVIALGHTYSFAVDQVAPTYPATRFVIVDAPVNAAQNVTQLGFDELQGTYLAGTIAASATRTGRVSFLGGTQTPELQQFADAFRQGARAVRPKARVSVGWVAQEASGFEDPSAGQRAATALYKAGNDVVLTVAFASNPGVFQAAASQRSFAIGMETDEYAAAPESDRSAILTSVIKDTSVPVYAMIRSAVDGAMLTGTKTFGVSDGAVTYARSNPAIQPYETTANSFASRIAAGSVKITP